MSAKVKIIRNDIPQPACIGHVLGLTVSSGELFSMQSSEVVLLSSVMGGEGVSSSILGKPQGSSVVSADVVGVGGGLDLLKRSLVLTNSTFWKAGTAMKVVSGKGTTVGCTLAGL